MTGGMSTFFLVSARTGCFFLKQPIKAMARTLGFFYNTSHHFQGRGKGTPASKEKGFLLVKKSWHLLLFIVSGSVVSIFTCESLSLLCTFIINFVVVTVVTVVTVFLSHCCFQYIVLISACELCLFYLQLDSREGKHHMFSFTGSTKLENIIPKPWQPYTEKKICKCIEFPAVSWICFKR